MLNRHYKQLLSFLKARLQVFPTLDDSSKAFDKAVSLIGLAIISPSVCNLTKLNILFDTIATREPKSSAKSFGAFWRFLPNAIGIWGTEVSKRQQR